MAKKADKAETVVIRPVNFQTLEFKVRGTSPLVQSKFSAKALLAMREKHEAGSVAGSKRKKEPRDFQQQFKDAMHVSSEGWVGVPASAFRNACIDVCRMVGFKMTFAKMSVFIHADGLDSTEGQPLVRLLAGDPEVLELATRNATGVADIRVRPMWREWGINLRVRFDADQFSADDIANLLERAGQQVGIGEGRPFSKSSAGMGYGTFTIMGGEA